MKFAARQGSFGGFLHKDDYGVGGAPKAWLFNVTNGLGGVVMEVRNGPAAHDVNARESSKGFLLNTGYNFIGVRQAHCIP